MRSTARILLVAVPLAALFSLPVAALMGGPKPVVAAPVAASTFRLPGNTVMAELALVPGATVGSVGIIDASPFAPGSGATKIIAAGGGGVWAYNSLDGDLWAPLWLPAGATLWQIDYYGFTTGATTQSWMIEDRNSTLGTWSLSSTDTGRGPGIVHGTQTWASGFTLPAYHQWDVGLSTSSTSGYVGAVFQYTLPTLSLVPIAPARVFDSRFSGMGGRVVTGAPRTIQVKDALNVVTGLLSTPNAIPQGARAIAFNITVTGTLNAGYVTVLPGASTAVTASTINWTSSGAMLANGGIVSLGTGTAERQITLVMVGPSASADVIIDVTGYYQ